MNQPAVTLEQVKNSQFGCSSCLWCSCECSKGSMFTPATVQGNPACGNTPIMIEIEIIRGCDICGGELDGEPGQRMICRKCRIGIMELSDLQRLITLELFGLHNANAGGLGCDVDSSWPLPQSGNPDSREQTGTLK